MPLDPHSDATFDGPSEFCWGPGMFPPGVAQNEGQARAQDDFGVNMVPPRVAERQGSHGDNYARMVADRRTDSLDPESNRDFDSLGNTDRYGASPPLVRADTQPNISQHPVVEKAKMERKW